MPIVKWLGVVLYAAMLVIAPFEHHDLVCHLKNPQHCTSCSSSQLSTDPVAPADPGACNLADAGRAVHLQPLATGVLLAADSTGRSPPAAF